MFLVLFDLARLYCDCRDYEWLLISVMARNQCSFYDSFKVLLSDITDILSLWAFFQLVFTCSKSTMETTELSVKSAQSSNKGTRIVFLC